MMNCEKYKDLIIKYLDAMIIDDELSELRTHAEACSSCRAELDRYDLMKDAIKQVFSLSTSAEQAGAALVAKVSAKPM
jgi:anti-sigma factor RsiW